MNEKRFLGYTIIMFVSGIIFIFLGLAGGFLVTGIILLIAIVLAALLWLGLYMVME